MKSNTSERLYDLLPAIYRVRDEAQGSPLRALLAVIEGELRAIESDIGGLYNNWFIETCEEWVVPYIGDLLGVHGLHEIGSDVHSLRPYIANTLAYRRRKGTAAVLEQLAVDVTGWSARVVEFFQLLGTTQYLNHLRPENLRTPDLRRTDELELLGTPFERVAHTAEVRSIASGRGKYNIPNVGLFLWRLQNYTVTRSTAYAVASPADGRYQLNPLGHDLQLFNRARTETEITHLAEESDVPGKLRRRPLYDELEVHRQAITDGAEKSLTYFDSNQPVLEVFTNGNEVYPEHILICDLSNPDPPILSGWQRPPTTKKYVKSDDPNVENIIPIKVAVDPVLGRLAFPGTLPTNTKVQVSYTYTFSGDLGGGPYDRQESVTKWYNPLDDNERVNWQIGVTQNQKTISDAPDKTQLVDTLRKAVEKWNIYAASNNEVSGIITIMDSSTYTENLTGQHHQLRIPKGCKLAIVAADWPVVNVPDVPGQMRRVIGQLTPNNLRPHLRGELYVVGTPCASSQEQSEFIIDGLLIEGRVMALIGDLGSLRIGHCTLVPSAGGLQVNSSTKHVHLCNDNLRVELERSICGPIDLATSKAALHIVDSIIHNPNDIVINAGRSDVDLQAVTVFGRTIARSLKASDSIFTKEVNVEQRQTGCLRFSFVPDGSRTPRLYRCQPGMEIAAQMDMAEKKAQASNETLTQEQQKDIRKEILRQLIPIFSSSEYGQPDYAQLHLACPEEIRTGAEDMSEMGAFSYLKQPQREANLQVSLKEYLRFGLESGIFYVT